MKTKRAERNGFSLVEILIVIAMLGLLVALAIPPFKKAHMSMNDRQLMHIIAEKGLASDKPIELLNGWYYLNEGKESFNSRLAAFTKDKTNLPPVRIFQVSPYETYGTEPESSAINSACYQLEITNGCFALFRKEE